VVTRWTKYGKDRVYVDTPGHGRLGCLDLQTGLLEVTNPMYEADLRAALCQAGHAVPPAAPADHLVPARNPVVDLRGSSEALPSWWLRAQMALGRGLAGGIAATGALRRSRPGRSRRGQDDAPLKG
jgi:hypothetical protein